MEIYKNDYLENEDPMMWELHEIRHRIHKEIISKSLDTINNEGQNLYKRIQEKYSKLNLNNS